MNTYSLLCPDIGIESAAIIDVHVSVGDQVQTGDSVITLESDKASMDVPADKSGVVQSIAIQDGQSVSQGDLLITLEIADSATESAAMTTTVATDEPQQTASAKDAEPTPVATSAQTNETATHSMLCPDIGIESAAIIDVHVAIGDQVQEGDAIITLESDKASMDVPADKSGVVQSVEVQEGGNISQGAVILLLQTSGSASVVASPVATTVPAPSAPQPNRSTPSAPAPATSTPSVANKSDMLVYAGPATRRLARKLGIELSQIAPTGPRNRVTMDDVFVFARHAIETPTTVSSAALTSSVGSYSLDDFTSFGEVVAEPLSRLQTLTAEHMHNINLTVPQVTQHDMVDVGDLEVFRASLKREAERRNTKVTLLPFVMKICAMALKHMPVFNSSVDLASKQLFRKSYYHIGFAADTPNGLLVPVVRDVLGKSIWDLSAEIIELATAAKKGTIKPPQMQGGCFTISSLGSIGGTHFTPIVNMPEVAILGIGKAVQQPVCKTDGSIGTGLMLPLSLSYDHRVVNGADGARMVRFIADALQDLRQLVLL